MFGSGPPGAPAPPARLVGALSRVFDETSPTALDPALRPFLADLVRPYGTALREDLLAAGVGHSFGEMAERLLPAVVGPDEPVDLLIVAFAMHDLRLGRATACYLSDRCPGKPNAFAVCDQGSGAAFTALRLAGSYLGTPDCSRALVFVVEQSALHYEPLAPAPIPDRHTAVVLRLESGSDGAPVAGRQHTGVDAKRLPGLLLAEIGRVSGDREDVTVVGSARLAAAAPGLVDVVTDAGQPYTGIWADLAGRADGLVVLADHEPSHGLLCLSTVDFKSAAKSTMDADPVGVAA
ncbi:hypothetical protein [Actinokineospora enzanensis]|uniref:hypothetical protein n=1 Tax=Actinokineospora enzanensis TaxID=155975 RepID=UPI0003693632|nr:hypothetical protein [Actinokineospora enzanensis]